MGIRKNYRGLTQDERNRFIQALHDVKARGVVDDFARIHASHFAMGIHRSSHFLPWHREFIRRFEVELQNSDRNVSIPYWDSTLDVSPSDPLWKPDFLGQFDQLWRLNRVLGSDTLPTGPLVEANQRRDEYDEFWSELEVDIHNPPHRWVGGVMGGTASPGDPVFFMHHAWIDMLWVRWQGGHQGAPFVSSGQGFGINDPLMEWSDRSPADVLSHHALGYRYDIEGWQIAGISENPFPPGCHITDPVRQTDTILASLAVDSAGHSCVIWLDQGVTPQQWRVAGISENPFPPGCHITDPVRQTDTILASLAVDSAGHSCVIWLDQGVTPQQWRVAGISENPFPPGCHITDPVRQTDTILASLAVDSAGHSCVIWLDQGVTPQQWRVAGISENPFPPGCHITDPVRQTDTILASLAVDSAGHSCVIWLDQGVTPQQWRVAGISENPFPPGCHITDPVRQTDTILASLAVDSAGHSCVIWLDQGVTPQQWRVAGISENSFPPGCHITDPVRQTDTILASLAVDSAGHSCVIWLDQGVTPQQWRVAGISENSFPPGCHITDPVRQTDTILASLAVDSAGHSCVIWLDQGVTPQQWRVAGISENPFPAGCHITDPVRQTDTILASLAVDSAGHSCVIWLDQT